MKNDALTIYSEILSLLKRQGRVLELIAFNQINLSMELTESEKNKITERLKTELSKFK